MKRVAMTAAAVVLLGAVLTPAIAQDRPDATPPKTMGDEGKLPATDAMSGAVPDMGATPAEPGAPSTSPKGPPKTMGDEGKLPATKAISGAVPPMKGSDGK
jgi:hypothetical protein